MRHFVFTLLLFLAYAGAALAKDVVSVYVSPTPRMHCESCEKKIRKALQFEKGMKDIRFDIEKNVILLVFDQDKTSLEKLAAKLEKIGYKIEVVEEAEASDAKTSLHPTEALRASLFPVLIR
ncbi:heavy-metal-associated domain-containing protein [Porphyromonas gulae]|uniref:heavy-metal-associated domain-containing protein n=1 Tax=Porphyromonas gulae TaxID=111105 RepID=UPI00068E756A|nr:heavy metal-associated domain-containing protein [Porphyromonas gulae]